MAIVHEDHVEKREKDSKALDEIVDWKRYRKDKPKNIIILSSFQLKKFRTVLRAWLDLNEMVDETIKKEQTMCGRRWYGVDNIMEDFLFPTINLIENACPPKLMIEQVEWRRDEASEKIQGLNHITIEDVDRLIIQPLAIEGKVHIYIRIWNNLAKNEMKNYRCDVQLGFESYNYPNIEELLGIWNRWAGFLWILVLFRFVNLILMEIYSL